MRIHRIRDRFAATEEILAPHASVLGGDFPAYRNHLRRVLNFHLALSDSDEVPESVEIAGPSTTLPSGPTEPSTTWSRR